MENEAIGERLTCQELVELLTDYLEDALPPPERIRFEQHIAICPPCRAYLRQARITLRLVGELSEDSIPEQTQEELLAVFRGWRGTR